MDKIYRPGAIGALTDEYEKALMELKTVLAAMTDQQFTNIIDDSLDEDFKSARNIVLHMVISGYVYADHIRKRFGDRTSAPAVQINNLSEAVSELEKMFSYTVETFEDKWQLTDDDLLNTIIKTSWTTYDLEALIEHAVVHILRHRRQIQKMMDNGQ